MDKMRTQSLLKKVKIQTTNKDCRRTSSDHDTSNTKKAPPPPFPCSNFNKPPLHVHVHLACTCCNINGAPPKSCPPPNLSVRGTSLVPFCMISPKVKPNQPHIGNTHTRPSKSPMHASIFQNVIYFNQLFPPHPFSS